MKKIKSGGKSLEGRVVGWVVGRLVGDEVGKFAVQSFGGLAPSIVP